MTGKSHDPRKDASGEARKRHIESEGKSTMPPAGPHAEPHLTNPDATPGTGSLTKSDHGEVETDPGGG